MGKGSGSGGAAGHASELRHRREPEESVEQKLWREEEGVSVQCDRFYFTKAGPKASPPSFTMAEVAKHNKRDDLWIIVDGKAYDVTKYVDAHPGGWLPMVNMGGKDCTDVFANYHPAKVYEKQLPYYYKGDVSDYYESDFVQEHRQLRQYLLEKGMFETRPSYYVGLISWYTFLFASALYLTLGFSCTSAHMAGAVLLGVFWQQLAFIGHDIGHNSVTHVRSLDLFYGILFGNSTGGISLAWWKRSHNVHHIVCNSIEHDPDIQHLPFFAVTEKIMGKFFSTYHSKEFTFDAACRWMVSYQHILFYPIMAVARINLYLQGWLLLLSSEGRTIQYRKLEIATLSFFLMWFGALLYSLPTVTESLCYLLLSHAVAGVLHVQICLSHFTMDTYNGHAYNDESDEWFRMQVATTMNVDCPTYMDWFHGGLQFQIEHHLWPRLPRHNLREAAKLTKALCEKHGIRYHAPTFIDANKELVDSLRTVAYGARKTTKKDGGFYASQLWDGLNARG